MADSRNISQRLTLAAVLFTVTLLVPSSRLGAEPLPAPTALVGASAVAEHSYDCASGSDSVSGAGVTMTASGKATASGSDSAHPLSPGERLAALRSAQAGSVGSSVAQSTVNGEVPAASSAVSAYQPDAPSAPSSSASGASHPLSPGERLAALRASQEAAANSMGNMSQLSPSQRLAILRSTYGGPNEVSVPQTPSAAQAAPPASSAPSYGGESAPLPQAVAVPSASDEAEQYR